MLLYTYIKRVKVPLATASYICTALLLCMFVLPVFTTMILFFISAQVVTNMLFKRLLIAIAPRIPHETRRTATLILSMLLIATAFLFIAPHLFLFLNALPFTVLASAVCISSFIIAFERALFIPRLHLGNNYSLLNLLHNPRQGLAQLRQTLSHPSQAEMLAAQERAELNGRNTETRTPESLRLPNADYQQLLQRQTRALEQLPIAAQIDDMTLYQHHLNEVETEGEVREKRLAANAKQSTPTNPTELEAEIRTLIQMEALDRTSDAAEELEEAYCETLSPSQRAAYMEYRKLTRLLSPPYAECGVSTENVLDYAPEHFVMMQKRFVGNNQKCIAGNVQLLEYQLVFLDLFTKRVPKNPANNDPLYAPRDENGQPAVYTFHSYQTVKGHGVSFHLCEAIEAVLASGLKHIPANPSQPNPGAHRATPPLQQSRLSDRNAFSRGLPPTTNLAQATNLPSMN